MLALAPRTVDAVWAAVEPRLPQRPPDRHPLGCHRPRCHDRACFEAILFRLVTGCSWDVAGRLGKGSETTLRRRFNEWTDAGVVEGIVDEALEGYDRIIGLDLSEVAIDGSQHKAPFGGEGTGPNPVDRGKCGWKWSMGTDRNHAIFNSVDGSAVLAPTLFTSGDPIDDFDYFESANTSFTNELCQPRLLLFYYLQDNTEQGNPVSRLVYAVFHTNGTLDIGQTLAHTGNGYGTDADQLSDGRLAIAWTDTASDSERVAYLILNQDLSSAAPAAYLMNPDGRPSGIVSVTHDGAGSAIFTWMDSKWFQRIYYASINSSGEMEGPMAFRYSSLGGISNLQTSFGFGNAKYVPWFRYFMPLMPRN